MSAPLEPHEQARTRRMTMTELVGLLLNRGASERSSVTLTRNAKGETQIEVVVRTAETADVQTVEDATDKAIAVYDRLRNRYPIGSGLTAATPVREP